MQRIAPEATAMSSNRMENRVAQMPQTADPGRRRSIGFLNWAHLLDHYVILIFPTVVIGLEAVYGRSYGDLLMLSTAAFTAFGLFALPFGWLADHWSRRNLIAIYFLGTGVSTAVVGLAPNFEVLAAALFAVGFFAAIYHPVGMPMLIEQAVNRGRTVSLHGVFGNVGVSIAAGVTAAITALMSWRWAFFIPAAVFIVTGIVYLISVPDSGRRRTAPLTSQDVTLDPRMVVAIVVLFMCLALSSGLVFNALTITLPKIVDARMGRDFPLVVVGSLATVVFLCGAVAQLSIGRLVERLPPHHLIAGVGLIQLIGVVWVNYAAGWQLLLALAVSIAAVYAQVTVNDIVLARYTPPVWRGRIYALRFFLIFTSAGPAVWGIGWLYDRGGFGLVLWITGIVAAVFAANSIVITALVSGVESRRTRAAAQAAG
jgi:MFS family permease